MTHARTKIRQTFVEALRGRTAAANRVYDSRIYNLESNSLPCIVIFSTDEEIITNTITPPRLQERTVKIIIECYVKTSADTNIIIDNLAAEMEEIIFTDKHLQKFFKSGCRLDSTSITFNHEGDQPVAVATLSYSLPYRTREGTPEEIII